MQKVSIGSSFEFAEIHYDMLLRIQAINVPLTIASFYGPPDLELYRALSKTYASMQHFRDIDVCVFTINCIQFGCYDGTGYQTFLWKIKPLVFDGEAGSQNIVIPWAT